jgi:hypothetical protein
VLRRYREKPIFGSLEPTNLKIENQKDRSSKNFRIKKGTNYNYN